MTGDFASDMSDAAGTLWLDVAKRDWSDVMLEACKLTRAHMPALYEGSEITGTLLPAVAVARECRRLRWSPEVGITQRGRLAWA